MWRAIGILAVVGMVGCASSTNTNGTENTTGNMTAMNTGGQTSTANQAVGGGANSNEQANPGGAMGGGVPAGDGAPTGGGTTTDEPAANTSTMGCGLPDSPAPSSESSIDTRCPAAQAGEYLLVLYRDRVDAYRVRDFSLDDPCTFLDLAGNNITAASGMVVTKDEPARIFVAQPEEGCGGIYEFNLNGEFVKKVESNINLRGIAGLWNTFGDDLIAWSGASSNFYNVSSEGKFAGSANLPNSTNRIQGVTDLKYIDPESLVMTFRDRPPQVFKDPFNPPLKKEEIGPANTVETVQTNKGPQVIFSARLGPEGSPMGIVLYDAVVSGREPPERERILVSADDGDIDDGIGVLTRPDGGIWVLDSGLNGPPRLTAFDTTGAVQTVTTGANGETALRLFRARIFPDF
ncbi:MAG: hypothetical protein VX589_06480 [Myxococcota bacterium]|nr:hypothetical protein [Myxococcota bacterium]